MSKILMTQEKNETQKLYSTVKAYEPRFIELIREKFGIIVHVHQINQLTKSILEVCNKFQLTPEEYLKNLQASHSNSPLLEYLVAGITVGETYFFRDKCQMKLLENVILPRLIQDKREKNDLTLTIWSAGCATGEEIFTLVMLLYEILPDIHHWKLNLLGTDINKNVLQKTKTGHFSQWAMRSIPEYYKNHYFTQIKPNEYNLSAEIRSKVKFMYLNLNDDTYPSLLNGTSTQDLILCRNVLIYFDRECVAEIMKKLSVSLAENGYLILGASDPINIDRTDLIFHDEEGIYFTRRAEHISRSV